jgi:probable phosphoglycerate mutase
MAILSHVRDETECGHDLPASLAVRLPFEDDPGAGGMPQLTEALALAQRSLALPANAVEVLLIRHGASVRTRPGDPVPLTDGHGDPALAPEGLRQAQRLADRLRHEPIAAIFVSGLRRTVQTAAPLADALGLEPVVVPELREVHLGAWEDGAFLDRFEAGDEIAVRALAEERWDLIPGAEAAADFGLRVRRGVDAVVAGSAPGSRVAVFAHAAVIGELCRQATASRPFAFIWSDNGGVSRLAILPGGVWLLRAFNETEGVRPLPRAGE